MLGYKTLVLIAASLWLAACDADQGAGRDGRDLGVGADADLPMLDGGLPNVDAGPSCADDPTCIDPTMLDFTAFDDAAEQFMADESLSSLRVAIVHREHGIVHRGTYGNHDYWRPTLIASASKALSAGILTSLHDQGLLDLDAPVGGYAPEAWPGTRRDFSIAQALSNQSGLPGLDYMVFSFISTVTRGPTACGLRPGDSLTECGRAIYGNPFDDGPRPLFPNFRQIGPDEEFRYGGGQWQVSGAIAEEVSGLSWEELVTDTYVVPCELDYLSYGNNLAAGLVVGAVASGNLLDLADVYPHALNPYNDPRTDNPNIEGGAVTNAESYGQILHMYLRGGVCPNGERIMEQASVDRMMTDRAVDTRPGEQGYGLGWHVHRREPGDNRLPVVSSTGLWGTVPWIDRDRGYAAVFMIERASDTGSAARRRFQPILEAMFPSPSEVSAP